MDKHMERVLMLYLEYKDDKGWTQRYEHLTIDQCEAIKIDLVEKGNDPNTITISKMKG